MELTLLTAADHSGACRVAVRAGLGRMAAGRTDRWDRPRWRPGW